MNLTSKYMGFDLRSPLVVSASPLSEKIDNIKLMEDSGAGAIVLYSLYEEQIRIDQKEMFYHTSNSSDGSAEASSYFPDASDYRMGPEEYLKHIAKAKEAVKIPIIASLNGATKGGWTDFAKKMEEAGADAIELNLYNVETDMNTDSSIIENNYLEIVKSVKSSVSVPVAVKISPFFTSTAHFAKKLDNLKIDGLTLFNRFYQPDINLETLEVTPNVLLSTSFAMRLPLRWIAILKGSINASLAATSGINSPEDIIKMVMAGADVTMLASVLLRNGISHLKILEKGILDWANEKEYESIEQMKGSMSQKKIGNPAAFERAQYMQAMTTFKM